MRLGNMGTITAALACAALAALCTGCLDEIDVGSDRSLLDGGGDSDVDGDADADTDADTDGDTDTGEDVNTSCDENEYSGDGVLQRVTSGGSDSTDFSSGIAVLADGKAVITGSNSAKAIFGEGEGGETTVPARGFIAAFFDEGDLAWALPPCVGSCFGSDLSPLPDGSFVAVGGFTGTAEFGVEAAEPVSLTTLSENAGFVARFDANGQPLWVRGIVSDNGTVDGLKVTTGGGDGGIVVGSFSGTAVFGVGAAGEIEKIANNETDFFAARFDADGEVEWVVQAGPVEGMGLWAFDVAANEDGSAFAVGVGYGTMIFSPGGADEVEVGGGGAIQAFAVRLSAEGQVEWAKYLDGVSGDFGLGVAAAKDGSGYYLTSCFYSGVRVFGVGDPGETSLNCENSNECVLVAKYDGTCALDWVVQVAGGRWGNGMDVAAFDDGSVAVTGAFSGESVFGPGQTNETVLLPEGDNDIFVARYEGDGQLRWASRAGSCNPAANDGVSDSVFEWGQAIAAAADGSVWATGVFAGTSVFAEGAENETVVESHGLEDVFVVRYSP